MLLLLFKLKLYIWLRLTLCHVCGSAKDYSFHREREDENFSSSATWWTCLPFGLPCLPSIPMWRLIIVLLADLALPSTIIDCCVGGHCHSNHNNLNNRRHCHSNQFDYCIGGIAIPKTSSSESFGLMAKISGFSFLSPLLRSVNECLLGGICVRSIPLQSWIVNSIHCNWEQALHSWRWLVLTTVKVPSIAHVGCMSDALYLTKNVFKIFGGPRRCQMLCWTFSGLFWSCCLSDRPPEVATSTHSCWHSSNDLLMLLLQRSRMICHLVFLTFGKNSILRAMTSSSMSSCSLLLLAMWAASYGTCCFLWSLLALTCKSASEEIVEVSYLPRYLVVLRCCV